jgi:hypothetical protein
VDRLLAQAAASAGDDGVRAEAAPWREMAPERRLEVVWALCAEAAWYRALWSDELRVRAERPEPLPDDALVLLARMRGATGRR